MPEIALTPQTIRRFVSRFPGVVGSMHSRLSAGRTLRHLAQGTPGCRFRSSLGRAAPCSPHLTSWVLSLSTNSTMIPITNRKPSHITMPVMWRCEYAQITRSVCVLGSATPDIVSRYHAAEREWHYLSLPLRILAHRQAVESQVQKLGISSQYRPIGEQAETIDLPPVEVVDMRTELQAGNRSIFSRALQDSLTADAGA